MPMIEDDGFEALLEPFYNGKKLSDPIATKEDKYQLLPAFLKVKGRQPRHPMRRLEFWIQMLTSELQASSSNTLTPTTTSSSMTSRRL